MCSKLLLAKYVLEESLVLKTAVFRKFCKTCRNISMTEVTAKEVTMFRVANFLNEVLHQMYFILMAKNIKAKYKVLLFINATNT